MNTHFIVPGTENVVDLKKYKTFSDIRKLFAGYKIRLLNMAPDLIEVERARLIKEVQGYPTHTLTAVKVQIFENATKTKLMETK